MNDPPSLVKPKRLSSQTVGYMPSSRMRVIDDFIAHLAPNTAVDSLLSDTGPLRSCLNGSSAAEREFATRAALTSQRVWEWLLELNEWNWPKHGGPAGFEKPSGTRRKLFVQVTNPEADSKEYIGSLLIEDVARYEMRIEEIHRDMDALAVEEIKGHVLTDHIMPLSRPTTPSLGINRLGALSLHNYNKMEDLTAVITAIVVQTLPNMAKLSSLLNIWGIRLDVLRHTPSLLLAIERAEGLLQANWEFISPSTDNEPQEGVRLAIRHDLTLSRDSFEARRRRLAKAISKPGGSLDHMLDCLEGLADTLPDEWLDRMGAVEQGYGEWVAACERKIREAEWVKTIKSRESSRSPPLVGSSRTETRHPKPGAFPSIDVGADAITLPVPLNSLQAGREPAKRDVVTQQRSQPTGGLQYSSSDIGSSSSETDSFEYTQTNAPPSLSKLESLSSSDGAEEDNSSLFPILPLVMAKDDSASDEDEFEGGTSLSYHADPNRFEDAGAPIHDHEGDVDLPPLRNSSRRNSSESQTSTVVHAASRYFDDFSDLPEVPASPVVPKSRLREAEYAMEASPPSSPPLSQSTTRESSATLPDSPMISAIPEDYDMFKSSMGSSFLDEYDDSFSTTEVTRVGMRRESTGDQQLRAQICQIIESIPAKIKLSTEPPAINLNPPDLQLPRLKRKPSMDPFKRNNSALSTRTVTPSFTLSPAKYSRPRPHRGQQEIKVYHLSRSTGEAPIKLFIRCVGEHGERVMVRVGGGWADLSEYLKEYASHHGRRSSGRDKAKVEVHDLQRGSTPQMSSFGSSPPSRPASVAAERPPLTPLNVRKTRRSVGAVNSEAPRLLRPKTPAPSTLLTQETPPSGGSGRSRSSSRLSWVEDDSSFLGLAGPTGRKIEMSEENKAWVESMKERVRIASGEMKLPPTLEEKKRFGELGKVGGTKRLFRKR